MLVEQLLTPSRAAGAHWVEDGFLDVVGADARRPAGVGNAAMHLPALVAVYQRVWRPIFTKIFDVGGRGTRRAHERFLADIGPHGSRMALDIGCGPGLYTPAIAARLSGGVAVGIDMSAPMLRRAVRDNSGDRIAYVRGDAQDLPFPAETFDAAICLAALYLIPDPEAAVREMCRVLVPGGDIVIFTTIRTAITAAPGSGLLQRLSGVRIFDRSEILDWLSASGMESISRHQIGQGQFIRARKAGKPAR